MADVYFSLVVWTHSPNMDFFKNMLESIDDQEYREFELYILDDGADRAIEVLIHEFFPDIVDKVHYRKLKKKTGGAYAFNIGSHFAEGSHIVFLGQHDRLSPNTLSEFARVINTDPDKTGIIFTDHDELIGLDRMNPKFKSGFNKELLLHTPYIGDFLCISKEVYRRLGKFNEKAQYAYTYEYLLRADSKKFSIYHLPMLLYHKRVEGKTLTKEARHEAEYALKEHMHLAKSYLMQSGVSCEVRMDPSLKKWFIDYDESTFRRFGGDYIYLHDSDVKLYTRNNVRRMYGYLKQPDVAVVGIRFLDHGLTIDNIGYIVDNEGFTYPAFHGQKLYRSGYEGIDSIPRDVSMVDAGCCLIDEKVYRMLHGFNTSLTGRDAMLDFCLRAKQKGYRTVVIPYCTAKYKIKKSESTEYSHSVLLEKHGERFLRGDQFYNPNLPMGLLNYVLPGMDS